MIPLYAPDQVRALDERTIAAGTPSLVLMERAAGHLAREVARAGDRRYGLRVLLVCGRGNNGGDGIAAARRLADMGAVARVLLVAGDDRLSADAAAQLRRYRSVGGREVDAADWAWPDVVVDCMLGTGASGVPREPYAAAVDGINAARDEADVTVVACDVPTGVDADTGEVPGAAVRADVTVTLGVQKRGLWLWPASDHCGRVEVADIGLEHGGEAIASVLEPHDVVDSRPSPRAGVDKRSRGVVMLVAGSEGMDGAAVMAAHGALAMGVGLLTVATARAVRHVLAPTVPEAMTIGLADDPDTAFKQIEEHLEGVDAVGVGPGLGRDDATVALVRRLVQDIDLPLVLDADGLNAFRHDGDALAQRASRDLVCTPHIREFSRLLARDPDEVWRERLKAVSEASRRWRATIVLKGPGTIVEEPQGHTFINPTGTAALATGGTGDVLTGMLTAALASGSRWDAVAATVYVHGVAGEIAARRATARSVTAMDVAGAVPEAFAALEAA